MNIETKIGVFVLFSFIVSIVGVMKLSDVRLERRYKLYFIFKDVQGLRSKSPVKIAGVEIGRVEKIELAEGQAKVVVKIDNDVPIYENARVRVRLIGLIGSQFLDLQPGSPEKARLKDGDILYGDVARSFSDLMDKLADLVEGKDGKGGIGDDLKITFANLRSVSDSLNQAIGLQKQELTELVKNLNEFTVDLKGMASDLHHITSTKKEDIEVSITKLRSLLERLDELVQKVQSGEGAVGRLVSDKEMGDEVKKTVTHLKQTAESAKDVLARFTKMRSFWEFQLRAAPGSKSAHGDAGIRLQPREKKYYYLGVNNAGDRKDEFKNVGDYEKKNTITAVLGKEFGPVVMEAGAIRSSAGVGLKYYPFKNSIQDKDSGDTYRKVEFNLQAFDFPRNETRGAAGQERKFSNPQYNLGAKYRINRWVYLGAAMEDIAEIRQYNLNTQLVFEDRDLAYLFGFVSFAR
ncbi:MAG: hypothetical protein A3I11_05395 [Elusimicrobia bacterium RIFCSPLOWO2_02_FULL_39_32]|nr:MAG: hypothetical protein A3B80_00210 [Elusimicrobia bacterium RIFCSPHIGHO2_02_FULL_39_36]OGR91181.1 MAG: hypothetical protein A3I11_05395 [Elusimicrobia bacterium RIFCSPLOWO2_02_FULL_39_32]OGS00149.1 MAG: hypothetical protein A3G85_08360 [Elusimicrobia bacterium RIFCSPLOWO2_12_FULL_39_28]